LKKVEVRLFLKPSCHRHCRLSSRRSKFEPEKGFCSRTTLLFKIYINEFNILGNPVEGRTMNIKLVALVLVIGLLTVGGVWFLLGTGSNEKPSGFTVGPSGGPLNYLDKVVLVIEAGTFNEETAISITESTSSSQDPNVKMLSEF
jgi:hypothetical protein